MVGVVRDVKVMCQGKGAVMIQNGNEWEVPAQFSADDAMLLSNEEWKLQSLVEEFGAVCERRNLM